MKCSVHLIIFITFFFVCSTNTHAQLTPTIEQQNDTSNIVVSSINITGNKHTKSYIILREIQFKVGDTLTIKNITNNFNNLIIMH